MPDSIIFRQLFDQSSATFSYLLADVNSRQAFFIDTVYEQHERDLSLINELELKLNSFNGEIFSNKDISLVFALICIENKSSNINNLVIILLFF